MVLPGSPPKTFVLVVEDEPVQRLMAIDIVEELGFEAVEAASTLEAIRLLESRSDIRVVFTDIDMPGGEDGMKLAAAIRRRWPPIEIVIVSGRRIPDLNEIPARGIFYSKPYRREQVMTKLREFASQV